MSRTISEIVETDFIVFDASTSPAVALRAFAAAQPAFVVVQRPGNLFYSYVGTAWRERIESARSARSLVDALNLHEYEADAERPAEPQMAPADVLSLLRGSRQPGRGAVVVVDAGQVIGVVTIEALRQALNDIARPRRRALPPRVGAEPPVPHRMRAIPPPSAPPPAPPASAPEPPVAGAEPPTAAGAETVTAVRTLQRYAQPDFPPEIVVGQANVLSVSILKQQLAGATALVAFSVPAAVKQIPIQVYVQAPGFIFDGPNLQEVQLPVDGDSDPVEFTLTALPIADKEQPADIRVRFRYEGKFLGQIKLQTIVKQVAAPAATRAAPAQGGGLVVAVDSPQPDILIEVNRDTVRPSKFYVYLQSNIAGRRYYQKAAGVLELGDNQTAATYTTSLFSAIQEMNADTAEIDLAGVGNTLWNKLPPEFQAEYWALMHENPAARAIQIITDEAYIPWELLKPFKLANGTRTDCPFWGETFSIGRWDPARPIPQPLMVTHSSVVVPDYPDARMKLPYAQHEIETLVTICGAEAVSGRRADVVGLLQRGGWQMVHFACHGEYDKENPDLSKLLMEDSPLLAATIAAAATGVAGDRPFVFLNACAVGQQGITLTHLGGWAEVFCANGFSGFVGPLWEVDDEVAYTASGLFYKSLRAGATLGEALQNVRQQWKGASGDVRFNPTWLAYSLHSDPMLKVAWAQPRTGAGEG